MSKSYAPQVIANSTGQWSSNSLRFATFEEAYANVRNLASKWFSVREYRVVPSDDPPNYKWIDGKLEPVESECDCCGVELTADPPLASDKHFNLCHQCNCDEAVQS